MTGGADLLHVATACRRKAFVGRRRRQTGGAARSHSAGDGTGAAVGLVAAPSGMVVQHVLERMRIAGRVGRVQGVVSVTGHVARSARSPFASGPIRRRPRCRRR